MFGIELETIYNVMIPFAVYVQSQAFMYPDSWFQTINVKSYNYFPDFYDHFNEMLQLGASFTGEPGWD